MMKMNDKSDVESLSYLRLAIHNDLQSQLEDNELRGFQSELLETCLMLLREVIFGPSWADEMDFEPPLLPSSPPSSPPPQQPPTSPPLIIIEMEKK